MYFMCILIDSVETFELLNYRLEVVSMFKLQQMRLLALLIGFSKMYKMHIISMTCLRYVYISITLLLT